MNAISSALKRLIISLLLGANLGTIALLWLSVAMTLVSPEHFPRLAQLALAFPVFLVADLAFVLLWLLFHIRLAWVPLAGALIVGSAILDYCPLHRDSKAAEGDTLTFVTYNVGGKWSTEETTDSLLTYLASTEADIICLQEARKDLLTDSDGKAWLKQHDYHMLQCQSEVILSHHPFLSDTIHIDYPTRSNHSFAAWVDVDGDSLLVVNNHLESNALTNEEKAEYAGIITDPHRTTIESGSHMMLAKLAEAAVYRGAQADTLCAIADRHADHDIIVCGDFNDTPVSYTHRQLTRRLHSAFCQAGRGPGISYSQFAFAVRIDHLFYPQSWTCSACRIDRTVTLSDHYPLTARLHRKHH